MDIVPYKNIINDMKAKEEIGDGVISYLVNNNYLDIKEDLKYLTIEFGYLFLNNDNQYESLLKVVLPRKGRVFYIAIQKEKLIFLNNNFNEELFRKTSQDMLIIHKVDINNLSKSDFIMELY